MTEVERVVYSAVMISLVFSLGTYINTSKEYYRGSKIPYFYIAFVVIWLVRYLVAIW